MQVGIDSSATTLDNTSLSVSPSERLRRLVEQIERADQLGLDVFGVGEHHRREFLDSAPVVILGADGGTNATYTSHQCRNGYLVSADPGTGVSRIRNPRSSVARSGRDGCGSWLIH